jgi:PKD repeat protein
LSVAFIATPGGGQPPYSLAWDFGDGNTSSVQNPSHTYVSPGSYTVTVVVTDFAGSSTSRSLMVTATESPPETSLPPSGEGPSPELWTIVLIAAVVAAGAVIGLRTWRQRKLP